MPPDGSLNYLKHIADVAELADAHDLGSCGVTRGGSSPLIRIKNLYLYKAT
jgi:hypothetical protein